MQSKDLLLLNPLAVSVSSGENNDVEFDSSRITINPSEAGISLTGFSVYLDSAISEDAIVFITNISSTYSLTIKHNSSSSASGNRVYNRRGADITLLPNMTLQFGRANNYWIPIEQPSFQGSLQASPSNPTSTTDTTGKMMGLNQTFTPYRSGNVMIVISGNVANDTIGNGSKMQIRYGTGATPTNGAALTGTAVGNLAKMVNPSIATLTVGVTPFTCHAIIALTAGTAYWFDLSLASITGGTSTITDISLSLIDF